MAVVDVQIWKGMEDYLIAGAGSRGRGLTGASGFAGRRDNHVEAHGGDGGSK